MLDGAALLYDEESFGELVEQLSSREAWEDLSRRALDLSASCSWDAALAPLEDVLSLSPDQT